MDWLPCDTVLLRLKSREIFVVALSWDNTVRVGEVSIVCYSTMDSGMMIILPGWRKRMIAGHRHASTSTHAKAIIPSWPVGVTGSTLSCGLVIVTWRGRVVLSF